jgi:peroxiredoxin
VVCRAEQPGLGQVAREFEGKVQLLGVSNNDSVSEGRKYQAEFEVPYPLANDASGRTWAAYGVPYQPVTVVVDQRGRVARRFDGGVEPEQLAPVLEYLVGT